MSEYDRIPPALMNRVGAKVTAFSPKTQTLIEDAAPGTLPCTGCPDILEPIEKEFDGIRDLILAKGRPALTRTVVQRIKLQFMLRVAGAEGLVKSFRTQIRTTDMVNPDQMRVLMGSYHDEARSDETDDAYLRRTIGCLVRTGGDPDAVRKDPDSTYMAWHLALGLSSGYLEIWDAPAGEPFIITDTGTAAENEAHREVANKNSRTADITRYYASRNPQAAQRLEVLAGKIARFQENFHVMPVSPLRAVVLVSPFFGLFWECSEMEVGKLSDYTNIPDKRLFRPENPEPVVPTGTELPTDVFSYTPSRLRPKEIRYVNSLLLERAGDWIAFPSFESVAETFKMYYTLTQEARWARRDYTGIFAVLNEME